MRTLKIICRINRSYSRFLNQKKSASKEADFYSLKKLILVIGHRELNFNVGSCSI